MKGRIRKAEEAVGLNGDDRPFCHGCDAVIFLERYEDEPELHRPVCPIHGDRPNWRGDNHVTFVEVILQRPKPGEDRER